jgi:hyperosmotically inducible protein
MSLKDKLELGLKPDAPYRRDNLPDRPSPETLAKANAEVARAEATAESGQPVTDAWITTKIQSKFFVADGDIDRGIDVTTTDGVVRLTGSVAGMRERATAEAIAGETRGVVRVVSELKIARRTSGDSG